MRIQLLVVGLIGLFFFGVRCQKPDPAPPLVIEPDPFRTDVQLYMTRADRSAVFAWQRQSLVYGSPVAADPTIDLDTTRQFQVMEGFGFTLTGGSAYVLHRQLDATRRAAVLRELFLPDSGSIGVSYLRISLGASDLSLQPYTYCDSPTPDPDLTQFNIDPEQADFLPILREILALQPDLRIMASPWSAPTWMKTNGSWVGGSLRPEYEAAYAQYFVRYIQAMQAEGIRIDAVTPQNEPENPYNNPSMTMTATQQRDWIKNHLGPAFQAAGLTTKIIVFDHNCDNPAYPTTILNDPDARAFVAGSAFHLYAGDISAIGAVQQAYPDKGVYFTEQYTSATGNFGGDVAWHVRNLSIGASRNGARAILEWNLAADQNHDPHTVGGCDQCLGALTIGPNQAVTRNAPYAVVAHSARFVRPGSVRIASSEVAGLPNVAYRTPAGRVVVIVLNDTGAERSFNLRLAGRSVRPTLPAGAVGTFVF
jgi:glucosylceramidase